MSPVSHDMLHDTWRSSESSNGEYDYWSNAPGYKSLLCKDIWQDRSSSRYNYIWDPLRLFKVGYDYRLYYFIKFTSLCKIVRSYSYTSIFVQYINKRSGDNTSICVISYLVFSIFGQIYGQ